MIGAYDRVKQAMMLESDRPHVFRQALLACRKGGTVSLAGVYGGYDDKIPLGAVVNKALTVKSGQTHVQHYMQPLLEKIQNEDIDPSFVITHGLPLEDAPEAYETFLNKEDGCIKVVLKPHQTYRKSQINNKPSPEPKYYERRKDMSEEREASQPYKCAVCGAKFDSQEQLQDHLTKCTQKQSQ